MNHLKNRFYLALNVALILSSLAAIPAGAQEPNRAGLVVEFGDGQTETYCVEFSETQMSGYEMLLRSGLEIVVAGDVGMGSVVCSIDGEGCPPDNCWCQCKTMRGDCTYWSYWHLNGNWVYSQMGLGGHLVSDGDVEGWRWGKTEPPPALSLEEICALPATDTPTPTVTPTATPSPTPPPTDTPTPTATWTPSPTALPPTETPLPTDTPLPSATATVTATPGPVFTPTAEAMMQAATTPAASATTMEAEAAAQGGKAHSVDTPAAATDTPYPATETPTAIPTLTVQYAGRVPPESSQTPIPTPTASPPPETPTPESMTPPTETPLVVALATVSGGETEAASAQSSDGSENRGRINSLVAILSIGAGVAYLLFGLFVFSLAAIFVVVRRK